MFRVEVLAHRADRLSGDVAIAVPLSWRLIGYALLATLCTGMLFIAVAHYDRVETVQGSIVPDTGIDMIQPSRPGVITTIDVAEGQYVAKGQQLATIRVDEDLGPGQSAASLASAALKVQDANLASQEDASTATAQAQRSQIAAQRAGLSAEIGELRKQIALQEQLVTSAEADLARVREIAAKGFISRRDIQLREDALVSRRQQLSQFRSAMQTKTYAVIEADRSMAQLASQTHLQSAQIAASRAQIAQQAVTIMSATSYILRAPLPGRISGLTQRVGQIATPQSTLMSVIPANSTLRAELLVPSGAVGFVRVGQDVRLALDAFPYQRFGTISGRIVQIAQSATVKSGPGGETTAMFPVTIALERTFIQAYGQENKLLSGMTLTARIITQRQTLLEWLFDPLLAIRRR